MANTPLPRRGSPTRTIIVDTLFGSIAKALHRWEKVEFRGFGSRNPGPARVDVPPKRVAYFKPGKELKELINREPMQPVPPP